MSINKNVTFSKKKTYKTAESIKPTPRNPNSTQSLMELRLNFETSNQTTEREPLGILKLGISQMMGASSSKGFGLHQENFLGLETEHPN